MTLSISIITPSFNQANFFPECLQSVASQSYPALEHLVYDPGSKDNSRDVARSFPHVTLIAEPDKGQSDAVSKGFLAAKGDIIGWVNSDDCYASPDVFATVVERFEQSDIPDIIYGRGTYIDDKSNYLRDAYVNEYPDSLSWRLHKEVGILQPTLFMRSSVIEKIGILSDTLHFCMDYEYWIRAMKAGLKFAFIPKLLAHGRYYKDNKTLGSRGKSLREICDTVKQNFGYAHIQWIRNYSEFLSEGLDGILENSSNQQVKDSNLVDTNIKKLLKAYNGDYYTLELLKNNKGKRPYNTTVEAMKKHQISFDVFCHPIPIEQQTQPNFYCYTVGEKRWAFNRKWKDAQIEKTKKAFEKFRSKCSQDTCVIVGNGPSLNQTDLSLLKNQDVFITNYAFLNPELLENAKYIAVTNYLVAEQGSHQFNLLQGIRKLFPYWLGYCMNEDDNTFFFNSVGYPEFSTDIHQNVSWRSTVSFFQMQIAYWLGYSQVLLIGFDHSYSQDAAAREGDILVCEKDDSNHFDPRYFKDKRWQAADVGNMEAMYLLSKQAFEKDGREIINCTVGGCLEVFRRSDLKKQIENTYEEKSYNYNMTKKLSTVTESEDFQYIEQADNHMNQENWLQAIYLYKKAILFNPDQPGRIYEKLGEALMYNRFFNDTFTRNARELQSLDEYQEEVLQLWRKGFKYQSSKTLSNGSSEFPRVLVISKIKFNQQAGGGVTMGNLFRGWPINAIAQIHTDMGTEADLSVCENYLYIPYPPTQILLGKRANKDEFIPKSIFPWQEVLDWCKQFSPDVIYARPMDDPSFYWWLSQELANRLNIPYVTHIMDDWPARYNNRADMESDLIWKPRLKKCLQSFFDNASANMGISPEMCAAYYERYQTKFVPFHNCIDISEWSSIRPEYKNKSDFTMLYVGAVTPDKELGSLQDIRDVILSLNKQGYSIRFGIYSAKFWKKTIQDNLEHIPDIAYRGYINPSKLPDVLSQADLLVLPINFDDISLSYIGYSLQTKVPEYMASGTPVLVYGPSSSPNVRYAKNENWGMVVDKKDKFQLEKAIISLIEEPSLREKKGQYARQLAFKNHNALIVRSNFRQLLNNAVLEHNK